MSFYISYKINITAFFLGGYRNGLTQISQISQKNASFHLRLPSGWPHTSDSGVCFVRFVRSA